MDFHHSVTQINCLTGAIISETYIRHILRMNIFNDYTILHSTVHFQVSILVFLQLCMAYVRSFFLPITANQCCGSALILVGWIQEGRNDPQKIEKSEEISCFEVLDVLF